MKILVTGGAGFIGTNLIINLLKEGHQVTSIDNYDSGFKSNHQKGCKYLEKDIKDIFDIKERFDLIFHLAGLSTMGWPEISDEERKYLRSLLFFRYNSKSNEIKLINNFSLNERIRDMKYIDDSDELYLFGETTGTLFHIKN